MHSPGAVAFQFGPLVIRWYGILMATSIVVGLWLGHREAQRVASPAEVEAVFLLDRHRQVVRQPGDRADVDQLAAQRTDRQLLHQLGGRRAARDDEHVARKATRVGLLAHVDAAFGGTADELFRHCRRLGDAILPARDRAPHVVGVQARDARRIGLFDRNAERLLHRRAVPQPRPAVSARGEEHVSDGFEQRRAELAE